MRRFFSTEFLYKFTRTLFPFLGTLAVGIALIWYPLNWWLGNTNLIPVLRDALMVAGIIGLLIELWSASVLVDHAAEELSQRLVGYGPTESGTRTHP